MSNKKKAFINYTVLKPHKISRYNKNCDCDEKMLHQHFNDFSREMYTVHTV